VQIDADPAAMGNRYPVEVPLVGDAAPTVQALLPLLTERGHDSSGLDSWRPEVERQVQRWRRITTQRALTPANPVNPERVVYELNQQLPADAQLAVDVGSSVYWYARQLQLPPGVPAHLSSTLATMGCSIPYGIAAKLLHPERPMVVLSGDGAMQMAGVNELITVSRLWPRWTDPRFVVCVINNGDLAEVSWEQREMESEPRFAASQALPSFPYAGYGQLLGLGSITVKDPEQLANAWQQALSADRPVVLEVITDPDIPLLPPFPAGESKLSSFEDGLAQEENSHARDLLRTYAQYERA
jgi:pyruvate dehydrogenase (quinone)